MRRSQKDDCVSSLQSTAIAVRPTIGLLLGYRRDSALQEKIQVQLSTYQKLSSWGLLCRDFLNSAEMTDLVLISALGIHPCATRTLVETGSMHMPCNEGYRTLVPH